MIVLSESIVLRINLRVLIALLESSDLISGIKLHTLKYSPAGITISILFVLLTYLMDAYQCAYL